MASAALASSRTREVEHRSASACTCEAGAIVISDEGWKVADEDFASVLPADKMAEYAGGEAVMTDGDDVNGNKVVMCQRLAGGTSIRVAPMERACGGWSNEHFHGEQFT